MAYTNEINYDWMVQIMRLVLTNQKDLFKSRVTTLIWNLFVALTRGLGTMLIPHGSTYIFNLVTQSSHHTTYFIFLNFVYYTNFNPIGWSKYSETSPLDWLSGTQAIIKPTYGVNQITFQWSQMNCQIWRVQTRTLTKQTCRLRFATKRLLLVHVGFTTVKITFETTRGRFNQASRLCKL